MLVSKKISGKKLAVYIAIIAVMFGSSLFLLFKNFQLTSGQPAPATSAVPAEIKTEPSIRPSATGTPANLANELEKLRQGGGLDLTIIESDKFKQLKADAAVTAGTPNLGKRDPFKPN